MKSRFSITKSTTIFLIYLQFLCLLIIGETPFYLSSDLSQTLIPANYTIVYSIPSMTMPFISGFIIDYIGVTYVLIACNIMGIFGQFYMLAYITIQNVDYEYLFVGRFLYGTVSETICISVFCLISYWIRNMDIGKYVGGMVILIGCESLLVNILSLKLFNFHAINDDMKDIEETREKFRFVFFSTFFLSLFSVFISFMISKADKSREIIENRKSKIEQHPDTLITFWKSLKRSLKYEFLLVCLAFALISCIYVAVTSRLEKILPYILFYMKKKNMYSYCTGDEKIDLEENDTNFNFTIHEYANLFKLIPTAFIILLPYFVGKYFIMKRKKYIVTSIGILLMLFSLFSMIITITNYCSIPHFKTSLLILSLISIGIGYSLQYGLLYATVSIITKENMMGTRFGIIHGVRNIFTFISENLINDSVLLMDWNQQITIQNKIYHYVYMLLYCIFLAGIVVVIYIFLIVKVDKKKFTHEKNNYATISNADDSSSFSIKKM